jgi:hypothetical protein
VSATIAIVQLNSTGTDPELRLKRIVCFALSFLTTGCLPYPTQSPRVEQGFGFGGSVALRPIVDDSPAVRSPSVVPEVGLALSTGFARTDGKGPAFRLTSMFGVPDILGADIYGQLPRVGPLIGGVGAMIGPPHRSDQSTPNWVASPYAMLGWERADGRMFYGSVAAYSSHRATRPESTATGHAIVIGVQNRGLDRRYQRWPAMQRFFFALYVNNHKTESITPLFSDGGLVELRSICIVGMSVDVSRPWDSFEEPSRPRRRP